MKDLQALCDKLAEHVTEAHWSVHESDAYYEGRYILGEMQGASGRLKITLESTGDSGVYELALQGNAEDETLVTSLETKIISVITQESN